MKSNPVRFYYKDYAEEISLTLPDTNPAPDDRGTMTMMVPDASDVTVDMQYTYEEGGRFYPFGEDVELYSVEPDTVSEIEITVKIKAKNVSYWWGKDPREKTNGVDWRSEGAKG